MEQITGPPSLTGGDREGGFRLQGLLADGTSEVDHVF